MSERPHAAVVISAVVHVAFVAVAALLPVQAARGGHPLGSSRGPIVGALALVDSEGGLHGNTVDIDGFVEGKLGDGAKISEPARQAVPKPAAVKPAAAQPAQPAPPAPPTPTPPTQPEPAPATTAASPDIDPAPKPRTKKKRRKQRKPAASPTGTGDTPNTPPSTDPGQGDDGGNKDGASAGDGDGGKRHGTEEAEEGHLGAAAAFTHALAISYSANPMWHTMPLGDAGSTTVTLTLTNGKVTGTDIPKDAPAVLRKIAKGASTMIRMRQLKTSGVTRLEVSVTLTQRDVPKTDDQDGTVVLQAKDEAPKRGKPGGVSFTYASGRHVQITIKLL